MAENTVTSKDKSRQEVIKPVEDVINVNGKISLNQSICELFSLESMCKNYEQNCTDLLDKMDDRLPDPDILLALLRTAIAKLDYFQLKYGFEIDIDDLFFVGDMLEFAKKKASLDVERKEFLKSQGHGGVT